MIKAVLFDLDGTLLDTNELIYNSFCHMFKEVLNLELPKVEITRLYGRPLEKSLVKYTNDREELEKMIYEYRLYNANHHDDLCEPFEGVVELLKSLKDKGIKLGIVTSKRKVVAERGMKISGIYEYMDVIISPESTEKHKPEGEPAMKACDILGVKPNESIMVGDSSYDLLCGKNAGCLTCGVEYTALDVQDLLNVEPTYMVKKAIDILDII